MAFEIDYWTLRKPGFQAAMGKLARGSGIKDIKARYNIARMTDLMNQEIKTANQLFRDLADQYLAKDEKGVPFKDDDGNWAIADGADKEEFEQKFEEFHNHKIKIERHLVRLEDIEPVDLSPGDLIELDPIIDQESV